MLNVIHCIHFILYTHEAIKGEIIIIINEIDVKWTLHLAHLLAMCQPKAEISVNECTSLVHFIVLWLKCNWMYAYVLNIRSKDASFRLYNIQKPLL